MTAGSAPQSHPEPGHTELAPRSPLSPEARAKLLDAFARGANAAGAAQTIGRTAAYIARIRKRCPDVASDIEHAKDLAVNGVLESIFKNAKLPGKAGDVSRIFILKNLAGWADRNRLDVTGKIDVGFFPKVVQASFDPAIEAEARKQLTGQGRALPPANDQVIDVTPEESQPPEAGKSC